MAVSSTGKESRGPMASRTAWSNQQLSERVSYDTKLCAQFTCTCTSVLPAKQV